MLPTGTRRIGSRRSAPGARVLVVYFVKGLGAYFSTYLMTDIGQRVVRDLRNQLFRHILDQSAGVLQPRARRGQLMSRITNDVNQVQQAVSETVGDLLREGAGARRLRGAAVLLDCAAGAGRASPARRSSSIRWCGSASASAARRRRSQEELEHLSHVTAEAFTGHRIVKAFGAEAHEERALQARVAAALSHQPEGHEHGRDAAAADGVPRRRSRSSALIWYGSRKIAARRA